MGRRELSAKQKSKLYVTGGFVHPALTEGVAAELGVQVKPLQQRTHPNTELYVRFGETVRGKRAILVQPHAPTESKSVNDAMVQLELMADAAKHAGAKTVMAICPYLGYSRQDRKVEGRDPIGIRRTLKCLRKMGVKHVVTVDLHSAQSQQSFSGLFDNLTMQPELREAVRPQLEAHGMDKVVVVAPDGGADKAARLHAKELGADQKLYTKGRDPNDTQHIVRSQEVGWADGRVCVVFDDMLDTAGTLVSAAEDLKSAGAEAVYIAATHGICSDPALTRLQDASDIVDGIYVADTHPMDVAQKALGDRLTVVPSAPKIGQALFEIITDGSVSEIFRAQNYM